jgi:hypothetical protein
LLKKTVNSGAYLQRQRKNAGEYRHVVKCDVSGSYSGVAGNACLLDFYAVLTRIYYRHFGGSIAFVVRVKQSKKNISDVSKAQQFFQRSTTIYQSGERNTQGEKNPKPPVQFYPLLPLYSPAATTQQPSPVVHRLHRSFLTGIRYGSSNTALAEGYTGQNPLETDIYLNRT